MTEIEKGNDSFELHSRILNIKQNININFLELGEALVLMHDRQLYKAYCPTWGAYLAQPELSIREKTAYELMSVARTFSNSAHADKNIQGIDRRKLARIVQFAKNKDFPEWIRKAKELSYSDLGKEIQEAKGKEVEEVEKKGQLVKCPRCGYEFYV